MKDRCNPANVWRASRKGIRQSQVDFVQIDELDIGTGTGVATDPLTTESDRIAIRGLASEFEVQDAGRFFQSAHRLQFGVESLVAVWLGPYHCSVRIIDTPRQPGRGMFALFGVSAHYLAIRLFGSFIG